MLERKTTEENLRNGIRSDSSESSRTSFKAAARFDEQSEHL